MLLRKNFLPRNRNYPRANQKYHSLGKRGGKEWGRIRIKEGVKIRRGVVSPNC